MSDCSFFHDRYFAERDEGLLDPAWRRHLAVCSTCQKAYAGLALVDRGLAALASEAVVAPPFERIGPPALRAARHQRQRQAVRRSLPFLTTGLVTAAAAAVIVVGVWAGTRPAPPPLLAPGAELSATHDVRVATLSSGATVRLESGAVTLTAGAPHEETLVLAGGRVSLAVPKLPAGATLAVRTPDAEVRVHGTRFEVVRLAQGTRVLVTEGVVEVRPEGPGRPVQLLHAGESTTVSSLPAYREDLRRGSREALDQGNFAAAEATLAALARAGEDDEQRAELEALVAWSLAARGDRDQARQRYVHALALLPEQARPLWAQNACAELAFLVEQHQAARAAATWQFCLRRFPQGVHADLALSRIRATERR